MFADGIVRMRSLSPFRRDGRRSVAPLAFQQLLVRRHLRQRSSSIPDRPRRGRGCPRRSARPDRRPPTRRGRGRRSTAGPCRSGSRSSRRGTAPAPSPAAMYECAGMKRISSRALPPGLRRWLDAGDERPPVALARPPLQVHRLQVFDELRPARRATSRRTRRRRLLRRRRQSRRGTARRFPSTGEKTIAVAPSLDLLRSRLPSAKPASGSPCWTTIDVRRRVAARRGGLGEDLDRRRSSREIVLAIRRLAA